MGIVVQFPGRSRRRFTPEIRGDLERLAPRVRGAEPIRFGVDASGAEVCRLANGLMVGWDHECGLILIDTHDGYVDRGPFHGVDEVCLFAAYLAPP